jgi:oligopeptidase B
VVAYLEAENAYADAMTSSNGSLKKTLYEEMLGRLQEDDATPPIKDGAWQYYRRFERGKEFAIHCRKKDGGAESTILDLNEIAKDGHPFVFVEHLTVSDDARTLAYLVDTEGFRQYTLKTRDLTTGKDGSEAIPRADFVAWAKDSKTLFYVTEDEQTKRPNKFYRHALGQDATKDTLLYEEKDEMFELDLERTRSRAYVVLSSISKTTSEVRLLDAAKPTEALRLVAPREHDHEYYVDHRGDQLYIRTNSGGRNFGIATAPASDPRRDKWKDLVAHDAATMIEEATLFQDYLVLLERKEALPQLRVIDLKTGKSERLEQPEATFDVSLEDDPSPNLEFSTTALRFRYQSPKTPLTHVSYDMKTGVRTVLKVTPVKNFDPRAYETQRILAPARDGTPIPVSLVFKKGTRPDGTHPLYLYGYGSYGLPTPLTFSSERVSLLDRGFVYAVAHVRGSGDLGKRWHDQGRMLNKMNTFTDFIDVAEDLKRNGWAKRDALVVAGGSAGGLLMGAVTNMRPDLFTVVLAYVPFVDVINTMLDETLPLTVGEFEEWGNPKNKRELDYMMRYSPYDNVAKTAYPSMLVRTSYNDSQVMYWEPAKWVAKLRASKTDPRPLLLKVNMQPAGHAGKAGRYGRLDDTAFDYAFVLSELKMAP